MQQLTSFLHDPNAQFVVLGMVLLGISSGVVGCFTFLRKRALVGDAIAHSVLPGVCLGFIFFQTKNPWVLLGGAFITGWLSLIVIDLITNRSRIKSDAAIGLVLSVFFGIGILLLTSIQQSGNAAQAGLDTFLFGHAAAMVRQDVITFGIVSVVLVLVILLLYKEFKLISFDMDFAQSIGLPVRLLEVILATITVLAVAVGIQAVGVVLMSAMLITPATAARYWTHQLNKMLVLASVFGALAGIIGAYVSFTAPGMPTGPWVVVVVSVIAVGSLFLAPKRGIIPRMLGLVRHKQKILEENILKTFYQLGEPMADHDATRMLRELRARRDFPMQDLLKGLRILKNKGLVEGTSNGWNLTEEGLAKSKRLVRIHRLWELYLTTYMRIAPDHVHDDAEAIEHIITPEVEQRLEELLEYPTKDPHQRDIPL